VDRTIELESAEQLVVLVMAMCLMDPASLGARIGDLGEIQCVLGEPYNIAIC